MENNFCQNLFGKFFVNFQFDRNAQGKFSDEISTKFEMSRLLKILLVDSLIFMITSNKGMLVFRQFEINCYN